MQAGAQRVRHGDGALTTKGRGLLCLETCTRCSDSLPPTVLMCADRIKGPHDLLLLARFGAPNPNQRGSPALHSTDTGYRRPRRYSSVAHINGPNSRERDAYVRFLHITSGNRQCVLSGLASVVSTENPLGRKYSLFSCARTSVSSNGHLKHAVSESTSVG
eukprot:766111-Prorocentrum_minimum.AAC.2